MYHWHLDYPSRGRLEKTFSNGVAEQKRLRSPNLKYVLDNNVWVNLKQKQLSMCMEIWFMFVANQVKSVDHATLVFKLNGIIKKINQTKRL